MGKIIQVLTDTNIGGAGRYLINMISSWDGGRYDLTVVCPEGGELERQLINKGVNLYTVKGGENSLTKEHITALCQIISKEKADIVHTHASLSGRIAGKILRRKVVLTRHGMSPINSSIIVRGATKLVSCLLTDRIIAVSRAVKINLIEAGVPADMINIIYNGIDLSKFKTIDPRLRSKYDILQEAPVIGLVARLVPEKGFDVALKAMTYIIRQIPEALMVIIGDGPSRQYLEGLCTDYNINKSVIFLGYQEDVENLVADFDVFLMPSISEGLGLALLEAMALAKPVIASETGGIPEVVKSGVNGILIPPGDPKSLALATVKILSSKDYAKKLGISAKATVFKKFSSKSMTDKTMDIYDQILQ